MRLGQLARQLEITPGEIVNYFTQQGIEINPHPNSKLDETLEQEVLKHFQLQNEASVAIPEPPENQEVAAEIQPAMLLTVELQSTSPATTEELPDTAVEMEMGEHPESEDVSIAYAEEPEAERAESRDAPDEPEVIKAPKIALRGLKVVGKIELPEEPRKKPAAEREESEQDAPKNPKENHSRVIRHHRNNGRKKLTEEERETIRLKNKQEKAKRLQREAEKQKRLEEQRLKAQKTAHYQEKIARTKQASKKKKKSQPAAFSDPRPQPKTILGRFWCWLNT